MKTLYKLGVRRDVSKNVNPSRHTHWDREQVRPARRRPESSLTSLGCLLAIQRRGTHWTGPDDTSRESPSCPDRHMSRPGGRVKLPRAGASVAESAPSTPAVGSWERKSRRLEGMS
jgi:hypothetical protein